MSVFAGKTAKTGTSIINRYIIHIQKKSGESITT